MNFGRIFFATVMGCFLWISPLAQAAVDANQLGARYDATRANVNFKVYSSSAQRIELYLYSSATGTQEKRTRVMVKGTGNVWALSIPVTTLQSYGITGTVYYGYRAWGANWPYRTSWTKGTAVGFITDVDAAGNRFNPNKLLADPYARELSHDPVTVTMANGTVYASGALYRNLDTGAIAPKSIVLAADTQSTGTKPTRAFKDDIVYEAHVRGLTMNDPGIAAIYRGTYKGAGLKAAYLASLGVTAVEFLPVQETQNDTNDADPYSDTGDNYWGYMTLNYFAPDRRFAYDKTPGGPTREFKEMVRAFHRAGIEVILDVVYNHTAEGTGGWLSFRGVDDAMYYVHSDDATRYQNHNGVGPDVATARAPQMTMSMGWSWSRSVGSGGTRPGAPGSRLYSGSYQRVRGAPVVAFTGS